MTLMLKQNFNKTVDVHEQHDLEFPHGDLLNDKYVIARVFLGDHKGIV